MLLHNSVGVGVSGGDMECCTMGNGKCRGRENRDQAQLGTPPPQKEIEKWGKNAKTMTCRAL